MTAKSKKPRWRGVLLRLLFSACVLLVSVEVLCRVFLPAPYEGSRIQLPGSGDVPLGEIVRFLRVARAESKMEAPRGMLPAGLEFRIKYDRPAWDYFDENGRVTVRINELGFRDRPFPVKKPEGEFRVLAVGDSFTFGQGVRNDDAWPQLLESALTTDLGRPVEVINGGFAAGSHYPPGYVGWIDRHGMVLDPDVLVMGLCLNDIGSIPMLWYDKIEVDPWLGGASTSLTWFQTAMARRAAERAPVDVEQYLDDKELKKVMGAVRTIQGTLAAKGVRFIIAVFPMLARLDDYPYEKLHDAIGDICDRLEIEHVDLLDRFRDLDEKDLWVHPLDQHPNDVGHRIIAEGLRAYLTRTRPR